MDLFMMVQHCSAGFLMLGQSIAIDVDEIKMISQTSLGVEIVIGHESNTIVIDDTKIPGILEVSLDELIRTVTMCRRTYKDNS